MKKFKTEISSINSQGSAKHGMKHWLFQRFTGLLMLFQTLWLVYFIYDIKDHDLIDALRILNAPYNAISMMLLLIAMFAHAALGMQVVLEDYIENVFIRNMLIIIVKIFSFVTIISGIVSMLYVMML